MADGSLLQTLTVPAVFGNRRANFGFESLARHGAGTSMLTGTEEALTVDGSRSTTTAGTDVRLLRLNVAGNSVTAAAQFAYMAESIHAGPGDRSGLSDLLYAPDGTVLALERSYAGGLDFLTRIYALDFSSATDVGQGALADGFDGETFTPVGKTLLYSGNHLNLEGLALGPQLGTDRYAVLGVVDNGGLFANPLISFILTVPEPSTAALFVWLIPLLLRRPLRAG